MKLYAIALDSGTPEKRNVITSLIVANNWEYWHWFDDFWIVDPKNQFLSPKLIYQTLASNAELATANILVFDFDRGVKFWGLSNKDAWKWMGSIGTAG